MTKNLMDWLKAHKFGAYTIAFLLMILPCIPLFWAANTGQTVVILFLLGFIALGNLLAVLVH